MCNGRFLDINGHESFTQKDEIVYADESAILTRNWNYRDCQKSQIRGDSQNVCLFAEALTFEVPNDDLQRTIMHVETHLSIHCGGKSRLGCLVVKMEMALMIG